MARRQIWPTLLKRASLVVPVALVLAGCNSWTMYGGDPAHSSYNSSDVINNSNVNTLAEWGTTAPITGTDSSITSSPTVSPKGMLYATANHTDPVNPLITIGELMAYPADGGTKNCETPTQGDRAVNCQPVWTDIPSETHGLTTAPAVDNSLATPVVYVGGKNGEVYAYNASNGILLWHSQSLGGSIDASLTIANGYIYVPEDYGWVYVFPSTTGTGRNDQNCWTDSQGGRECDADWGYSTGGNNYSTPAVANGMMYQAAGDHVGGQNPNDPYQYAVYAFNASYTDTQCRGTYAPHEFGLPLSAIATCAPAWSAPWQKGGEWDGGSSSPAVANGDVYIESASNGLLAFSASGDTSHCAGRAYVGQWGKICTPLWAAATGVADSGGGGGTTGPTPAVANGIVYIGGRSGEVFAFDASSGANVWSFATGGAIDSSVVVTGRASDAVALVGCSNGFTGQMCTHSLFAFDAANGGAPLWTAPPGGSVDNPPIVVDRGAGSVTGVVYATSDNQLIAYALPTSA